MPRYAGSVSLKLGFGRDEVARQNLWPDYREQEELGAYCLRIYVYQVRGARSIYVYQVRGARKRVCLGRLPVPAARGAQMVPKRGMAGARTSF